MRKIVAAAILAGMFFMSGCVGYVWTEASYGPPVVTAEPIRVVRYYAPPPPPVMFYHYHRHVR